MSNPITLFSRAAAHPARGRHFSPTQFSKPELFFNQPKSEWFPFRPFTSISNSQSSAAKSILISAQTKGIKTSTILQSVGILAYLTWLGYEITKLRASATLKEVEKKQQIEQITTPVNLHLKPHQPKHSPPRNLSIELATQIKQINALEKIEEIDHVIPPLLAKTDLEQKIYLVKQLLSNPNIQSQITSFTILPLKNQLLYIFGDDSIDTLTVSFNSDTELKAALKELWPDDKGGNRGYYGYEGIRLQNDQHLRKRSLPFGFPSKFQFEYTPYEKKAWYIGQDDGQLECWRRVTPETDEE